MTELSPTARLELMRLRRHRRQTDLLLQVTSRHGLQLRSLWVVVAAAAVS